MSAPSFAGTLPGTNPIKFSAIKTAIDSRSTGPLPLSRVGSLAWRYPALMPLTSLSISGLKSKPIWFEFTPCGATYNNGPTSFASAPAAYTPLTGTNASISLTTINGTSGIQRWVVPRSGKYYFVAAGGGGSDANSNGGRGAIVWNLFTLSQGDKIYILVGQKGKNDTSNNIFCGGGGTFVARFKAEVDENVAANRMLDSSYDKILIAGGGGSRGMQTYNSSYDGIDASITTSGTLARDGTGTAGTNGGGGTGGNQGGNGGGGAGWSGNGSSVSTVDITIPQSFLNGGKGSYWGTFAAGAGFGGGAGGWNGGAGGGGYSGGAGATNVNMRTGGGGGGSYDGTANAGAGGDATRYLNYGNGYNIGAGSVYVSWYGP